MSEALGPRNSSVQDLRRLFSSRRFRRREGRFAVEGPELLSAALEAGWTIEHVFVAPEGIDTPSVMAAVDRAERQGVRVDHLRPDVLERVADAVSPQPCAAIIEGGPSAFGDLGSSAFIMVLDRIQDPGNLGAVLRVVEACGADGAVLTGSCADPFGPKALRGSTGSAFRVRVCENYDLDEALDEIRRAGLEVVTTSPHHGDDFASIEWPSRVALVLGNEANGLDEGVGQSGDRSVSIPMAAGVESLNLAVSAGILAMGIHRGLRSSGSLGAGSTMHPMSSPETS